MLAVESTAMLAGLGAVLLPLVLHAAGRARQNHLFWPAIDLVEDGPRQARRWRTIRRWMLLAARVLAIGLLALAMAGLSWRPPSRQIIVVVDNSGSMAGGGGGLVSGGAGTVVESTRLQAALRLGGGVLADVLPGDRMMVMATAQAGDPHFRPSWTTDPSEAATALGSIRQSAGRADLAASVLQAAQQSRDGGTSIVDQPNSDRAQTIVWILTDRQEVSWASLPAALGQWQQINADGRISVRVMLVGDDSPLDPPTEDSLAESRQPSSEESPRRPRPAQAETDTHRVMAEEIAQHQLRRFVLPDTDRGDRVRLVDPQGQVSVLMAGSGGGLTVGPLVLVGDYEIVSVTGETLLRLRVLPPQEERLSRQLVDAEIQRIIKSFGGFEMYPAAGWFSGVLRDQAVRWLAGDVLPGVLWLSAAGCVVASWLLSGRVPAGDERGRPPMRHPPGQRGTWRTIARGLPVLGVVRGVVALAMAAVVCGTYLTVGPTEPPVTPCGTYLTVGPTEPPVTPAGDASASLAGRRVWIDSGATMAMPVGGPADATLAAPDREWLFDVAVRLGRVVPPPQWQDISRRLAQMGELAVQARSLEYMAARTRYARATGARTSGLSDLLTRSRQWQRRFERTAEDATAGAEGWDAGDWVRAVGRGTGTAAGVAGPSALVAGRTGQLRGLRQQLASGELAANSQTAAVIGEVAAMSRGELATALASKLRLIPVATPQAADLLISDGLRLPARPEAGTVSMSGAALLVGGQIDDAAITTAYLADGYAELAAETKADHLGDLQPSAAVMRTLWPGEPLSLVLQVRQEGRARVSAVRINYRGETLERALSFEGDHTTVIIPLPRLTAAAPATPLLAAQADDRRVRISLIASGEASLPILRENNAALLTARVWPKRIRVYTSPADPTGRLAQAIASLDDSFALQPTGASGVSSGVLLLSTEIIGAHAEFRASSETSAAPPLSWPDFLPVGNAGIVALMSDASVSGGPLRLPGPWTRTTAAGEVPITSVWPILPWPALVLTSDYFTLPAGLPAQTLLADDRGRSIVVQLPGNITGKAAPVIAVGLGDVSNWLAADRAAFWQAIIRRAAGRAFAAESSGVAIEAPAGIASGQSATVLVRVRREDGSPEVSASVAPLVLRVDGRVVRQFTLAQSEPGGYIATLPALPPGQYTLHFGGDLSPAVPLEVLRPRLSRLSADRASLAAAIGAGPGEVVDLSQLYRLGAQVSRAADARSSATVWYRHPLVFIALVALLGVEGWLAGRRGGMA